MNTTTRDSFILRIDQLLGLDFASDGYSKTVEAHTGALTIATAIYGAGQPQVQALVDIVKNANAQKNGTQSHNYWQIVRPMVIGSLRAMRSDIEAGVLGSIERRGAGYVLADMLDLAKQALAENTDDAKNVSAVLTAASFEDTIRRMGTGLADVQDRPPLSSVLEALKNAGVLVGAPFTTAQSYLKFRNDALHADWANINPAVVGSCLAFVELLLLQHFS
jgi:hypothetical protein